MLDRPPNKWARRLCDYGPAGATTIAFALPCVVLGMNGPFVLIALLALIALGKGAE